MGGSLEGTHDLRVHSDRELLVSYYLGVSCLNVLEYPVSKGLACQRVDKVDNPLTR